MNELIHALAGGAAPDKALERETLRMYVARQITCPINKTVLDIKRAVLIEITGVTSDAQIISAEAWDDLATEVLERFAELGIVPKVTDARLLDWTTRPMDYEELGVYRDVLNRFTGDETFARWCANRYPWGAFDLGHERRAYELLHRFADGDAVRLRSRWEDLPCGTTGRTVGRPYELFGGPMSPVQFIELPDRRRVVVPLAHLEEADSSEPEAGPEPPSVA
ncbi:hypothetical protein AGRA3207_000194 [Actinomadura graeca]|uniref:Uncharacterized protein n=1 Tax=Actinomadura graeca TaxID=2750812 RepID=A0ABX8QQH8_9ACTN|nr:hypothetical protein [Actinomadura graeca]QXJ19632.1 hypothetical protein AGRA3207_000194 [Actinomadura graeca]